MGVVDRDVADEVEGWPIVCDPDFQGTRASVDFGAGKLFFYESAKLPHGRPSNCADDSPRTCSSTFALATGPFPIGIECTLYRLIGSKSTRKVAICMKHKTESFSNLGMLTATRYPPK